MDTDSPWERKAQPVRSRPDALAARDSYVNHRNPFSSCDPNRTYVRQHMGGRGGLRPLTTREMAQVRWARQGMRDARGVGGESCGTPNGGYAYDRNQFAYARVTNGPLT